MAKYPHRKEYQVAKAADWASLNPVVESGLLCVEGDTGSFKIGDGTTSYNDLLYTGIRIVPDPED